MFDMEKWLNVLWFCWYIWAPNCQFTFDSMFNTTATVPQKETTNLVIPDCTLLINVISFFLNLHEYSIDDYHIKLSQVVYQHCHMILSDGWNGKY